MKHAPRTMETYMLANGKAGDTFYTHRSDKDMTVYALNWNRKIETEKLLLVKYIPEPSIERITRVTLGDKQ